MVVPDATTPTTEAVTLSERSGSLTVRVSETDRAALVSARVSAALSPAPTVITGASLVPVMVMVTVWSSKAPLSSVARTV